MSGATKDMFFLVCTKSDFENYIFYDNTNNFTPITVKFSGHLENIMPHGFKKLEKLWGKNRIKILILSFLILQWPLGSSCSSTSILFRATCICDHISKMEPFLRNMGQVMDV